MKKLLLLFLLSFIVIFSFAQTTFPTYQPIGNSVTLWDQKGAVRGTKGLITGNYTDTTAANGAGNYIKFYPGAQIFTTSDDQIWVRDATATRWINVTTGFSPTPTCGLQSGTGIVHYDSLLIFSVTAANYSLCCDSVPRTSAADSILLPPADPSNPVYVAIILDANGVNYVRGVPAANPSLPQLTDCQIALTYVLINAGDVVPANVSVTTIYDENYTSEWDSVTTSTLVMDTANTTFPVHLLKDIDVTYYGTGGWMTFLTATTVDLNNYGILKFYVRLKGVATIRFSLTWYLDGVQQTFSAVPLVVSGITGVYQVMAVPISAFRILNNSSVNTLRIQVFGTQGFYLDWIQLQSGIIPSSPIDNGFTTLNVGNLDSLFNSFVTFPIGQPVVNYTKQNVPAYTALVNPNNTTSPFVWNKINLATPIITGLLPVTNIAAGNANDILTTIGGVSTWVSSAGGYDTTITFNWLRSYPGTVRDSIAFGSPYLDSALLTFDTYVGLDNKFLKIMQDDEILFLLDPAGFSAFLRAYDGASESVIGTEADLVNSSLFFTLKSKNGADSVWIVGNGQNKKITFIADSLLFKSTLSGATTGMVWKLKDPTTGSGYWGTGASSLFIDARNGLTDSLGYVLLGGALYKATTVTAGVFAMNVNGSTGSFNSSFVSGGVTTSSNVSAGVGQFSTTQGSFSAIVSAVNGIVPITVTDGTKTSLLYTYPDSIINRSTDGIYKFYNMPSAVGTKAVRWDATTKQFTIADTTIAGSVTTLYTGNGTLAGNRIVNQNSNTLAFSNTNVFSVEDGAGGQFLNVNAGAGTIRLISNGDITFSSQTGSLDLSVNHAQLDWNDATFTEYSSIQATNAAGIGKISLQSTGTIELVGQNNATSLIIDDVAQTIAYTAGNGHTFSGNVGIGTTPSAGQILVVDDGTSTLLTLDKTNFISDIRASDGTADSRLRLRGNSGGSADFLLSSDDGSNLVTIEGDAIAQTITLTAANNVILGGYGSGTHTGTPTFGLSADASGNVIETALFSGADNGLTDSLGRVILGGTLYKNTTIATGAFGLTISTLTSGSVPLNVSALDQYAIIGTSSDGVGVNGNSGTSYGVYGNSTSNAGVFGLSQDYGTAAEFDAQTSGTSDVTSVLNVKRLTTGTAANGIGASISFMVEVDNTVNSFVSNSLVSSWTTAANATRTSQFIITGVNSAATKDLATFSSDAGLVLNGSLGLPYTAQTTTYPITAFDYFIDCTSGTFTTTLPTAVGVAGRIYVIKNSGAGTITIATTSSQTIDGTTTKTLSVQYTSYTIISDGANWKIY